jgi:pimeloyl-ACP methyl ester carboxylesterase
LDTTLAPRTRRIAIRGLELAVREWPGDGRPFLLVHGLASNARTWDGVARDLNAAGHAVVAVDQRGHGLSDKPTAGYGFDEVTADLAALIPALGFVKPILAGQSWGGNVVLELAARSPQLISGLVLVDGGWIELSAAPEMTWEKVAVDLKPPPLAGTPRDQMLERMRGFHADWDDEAIEMAMGNFETLPDGTIRPWLSLENHMQILRALWEQHPSQLYARVQTPTLLAVADSAGRERNARKQQEVALAETSLAHVRVRWFHDTAHDIHVHRPRELADWLLETLAQGFFD